MSIDKPWYYNRPWTCRWCGCVMSEHSLNYAKGKRREFCNFRCLHDFKNFMERIFGKAKLKAIIKRKNQILDTWVQLIPFEMIERRPMKPIAQHITSLLKATDDAEPVNCVFIDTKGQSIQILPTKALGINWIDRIKNHG